LSIETADGAHESKKRAQEGTREHKRAEESTRGQRRTQQDREGQKRAQERRRGHRFLVDPIGQIHVSGHL
jgi:hypothetical protein